MKRTWNSTNGYGTSNKRRLTAVKQLQAAARRDDMNTAQHAESNVLWIYNKKMVFQERNDFDRMRAGLIEKLVSTKNNGGKRYINV